MDYGARAGERDLENGIGAFLGRDGSGGWVDRNLRSAPRLSGGASRNHAKLAAEMGGTSAAQSWRSFQEWRRGKFGVAVDGSLVPVLPKSPGRLLIAWVSLTLGEFEGCKFGLRSR